MIIIKNITDLQEIFIPRNDGGGNTYRGRSYEKGYNDGVRDQRNKVAPITITENGVYGNPDGYSPINVDVPVKLQEKTEELNYWVETITPDDGFDGMSAVHINTQEFWDRAEREGQQYVTDRLVEKTITENGVYKPDGEKDEWGFKEVVVDVPQGGDAKLQEKDVEVWFSRVVTVTPDEGFDGLSKVNVDAKKYGDIRYYAGENAQKAKLTDITINLNGTYNNADGYKKVVVDVEGGGHIEDEKIVAIPEDYDWEDDYVDVTPSEGYDGMSLVRVDGYDFASKLKNDTVAETKAKMATLTATSDGTYEREDGYNKVVVNVGGTKINPNDGEIWIEQGGRYYFVYDSSVMVDEFTVHFNKAPMEGKYMEIVVDSHTPRIIVLFNPPTAPYIKTIGMRFENSDEWINMGVSTTYNIKEDVGDIHFRYYFYDETKVPKQFFIGKNTPGIKKIYIKPEPNAEYIQDIVPYEEIGDKAFMRASISVSTPYSCIIAAKRIGELAFFGFESEEIAFETAIEYAGESAFYGLKVKTIYVNYPFLQDRAGLFADISTDGVLYYNPSFTTEAEIRACAWWGYLEDRGWELRSQ